MKIPLIFGLMGTTSGVVTLAIAVYFHDPIYSPGVLFAVGLGMATWLTQRNVAEKIPTSRVVKALSLLALAFPLLVWLLVAISVVVTRTFSDASSVSANSSIPIGYWVGLVNAGVAAAIILWFSVRILGARGQRTLLWAMIGASLLVCAITVAVDHLVRYEQPLAREQHAWANWAALFLLGNTVMSFLYGLGVREALSTTPNIE